MSGIANKILILSKMEMIEDYVHIYSHGSNLPSEQTYTNYGLDDLSKFNLNKEIGIKKYIQSQNIVLGSGKIFTQQKHIFNNK